MSEAAAGAARPGRPRYKPYPAYKDSGVEWLGQVPAGWEVKRLKYVARLDPEILGEDTDPSLEMSYVDIGGVDGQGRIIERENLTFATAPSRARKRVADGDVIVSTVRTYLRAIAAVRYPEPGMVVSTGFAVVRPGSELHAGYTAHALRAPHFVERVVANSKGVAYPGINGCEMATFELPLPAEAEQHAIADFLDRETARIDALVAKKERLIELLEEKRTALITRAVTKGLDPNVPMKDSGVEWLGEIPARWGECAFKALLGRNDGGVWGADADEGEGTLVLRSTEQTAHGEWSIVDPARRRLTLREASSCRLEVGDLVVTKSSGSALHIGKTSLVNESVAKMECCFSNFMQRLRVATGNEPRYFWQVLNCPAGRGQLLFSSSTTTGLGNLTSTILGALRVPLPPLPEQLAIAAFLDRETARIDALIARVREAIGLLREYRTALISAAVTGKIDVREVA